MNNARKLLIVWSNHLRERGSFEHWSLVLLCNLGFGAWCFISGCAATSHHQFVEPRDWRTRSGQLLYRTDKTTLIGEVLVRFSATGDFELTFSKGPGLTLLTLRQDSQFAEVKGSMAGRGWSGRIDRAPPQLSGFLELREKLIQARDRQSIRHETGAETFIFRF